MAKKIDISAITVQVEKLSMKRTDILVLKVPLTLLTHESRQLLQDLQELRSDGGKVAVIDTSNQVMVIEHTSFKFLLKLRCWLFGCEAHPQEYCHRDDNRFDCIHCGEETSYGDLVGDTRFNRLQDWVNYWLFRKWWPVKCSHCGHRFGCDESVDHLPF